VPLPIVGRFLAGSRGDLGLWSATTGHWVLQPTRGGEPVSFQLGRSGDVLVPGDYDGDGRDEAAVFRPADGTWHIRRLADGTTGVRRFGTPGSVPIPADYNHDGVLDLAYWEPAEGRINVSYSGGESIDHTLSVPPDSVPAFVNWY
jgi:hypothetical protein